MVQPLNDLPRVWKDPDAVTDLDDDYNVDVDPGEGHLSLSQGPLKHVL